MTPLLGLFTYLIIWWTALFVVLPWGNAPPARHIEGHMPGAPANPRIRRKFVITTLVSAAIWLVVFLIAESHLISFRDLVKDLPE